MPTEPQEPDSLQNTCDSSDSPPRSSLRRIAIVSIRVVLISYVAILVMLVVMESRLVYPGAYMNNQMAREPIFLTSQPWEYPAQDGSTIIGQLLDRPGSSCTVLYLHGNAVKANQVDQWISRLSEHLNANVLAAEYRAFQSDDIAPHESNIIADSLAAHDALCQHYKLSASDLIVYGRSLGGGCAAAVASRRGTKTLILDRTFDSVANVAAAKYPMFPVRWLMKNQFDSVQCLRAYEGHLIQIHGTPDQVVPITNGKRLHESIPSADKVFLEIPDMGHNDRLPGEILDDVDRYIRASK